MATLINYELTYSNPAIKGHNGAETELTMEVFREGLGSSEQHYNQTTFQSNVINYASFVPDINAYLKTDMTIYPWGKVDIEVSAVNSFSLFATYKKYKNGFRTSKYSVLGGLK